MKNNRFKNVIIEAICFNRHFLNLILVTLLFPLIPNASIANVGIALVVNEQSKIHKISRDELAILYMGNSVGNSNLKAIEVLDVQNGVVRDHFYRSLLGKTRNQMHAYWARQVFTNRAIPPKELPEEVAMDLILKSSSVLTYLPVDKVKPGMRIVLTLD
jgi:hypothetical protein